MMQTSSIGAMVGLGEPVDQTVALMEAAANEWKGQEWTKKLARMIASQAMAQDVRSEARAVWSWVKNTVRYRLDPEGAEWVQTPYTTAVEAKSGDCDDMATLAAALLKALGHNAHPVAVHWIGREWPSHAVVEDVSAGCVVDPCTLPPEAWPPKPVAYLVRP